MHAMIAEGGGGDFLPPSMQALYLRPRRIHLDVYSVILDAGKAGISCLGVLCQIWSLTQFR
jgi:hypothetical protein